MGEEVCPEVWMQAVGWTFCLKRRLGKLCGNGVHLPGWAVLRGSSVMADEQFGRWAVGSVYFLVSEPNEESLEYAVH